MPISIAYNNDPDVKCTLRPTPLVAINMAINKTGAGENIGVTYAITLTGTILSDRGSPFGASTVTDLPFSVSDPQGSPSVYVPAVGTSTPGSAGRYGPYNLFYSGSNYGTYGPPPQIVDPDYNLDSIFSKQKAISALFARDGQLMEISPVHGDATSMYCNPRVVSISFTEGIYVNKCDYTIELEADTLRDKHGNVNNEGLTQYIKEGGEVALEGSRALSGDEYGYITSGNNFITDFSEEWSLETDEAMSQTLDSGFLLPRSYSISHSMSATGKTHYLPNGKKLRAWKQAQGFVQGKLMTLGSDVLYNYPNSANEGVGIGGGLTSSVNTTPSVIAGLIGSGTLDLVKEYGGYNRIMSESIDEAGGTYSLTETWLLATGTAYENYNISISKSNDSPHTEVSIDGTIKGLSALSPSGYGGTLTTTSTVDRTALGDSRAGALDDVSYHANSPIISATNKWNHVSQSGVLGLGSQVYKRANNATTLDTDGYRRLNPQFVSYSTAINESDGTISYNVAYNNRPINVLSNTLYENITVNDTYPGDVFATIPVIGRQTGPILQYIGGRTEYVRDLSIEVMIDRGGYWGNPNFETVSPTHTDNFLGAGFLPHSEVSILPLKPSVAEPNRTELQALIMQLSPVNEYGIRKYFVGPPTESWDPKEGRYTLNIQWTYELSY